MVNLSFLEDKDNFINNNSGGHVPLVIQCKDG
jgi:hypothetical protein